MFVGTLIDYIREHRPRDIHVTPDGMAGLTMPRMYLPGAPPLLVYQYLNTMVRRFPGILCAKRENGRILYIELTPHELMEETIFLIPLTDDEEVQ